MINITIVCSWNFFLPLLDANYEVVHKVNYFFNNLVMPLDWNNFVSLVDVMICFTIVPTWYHHWSMICKTCICLSSFITTFANLTILHCSNNKVNFFLHALNVIKLNICDMHAHIVNQDMPFWTCICIMSTWLNYIDFSKNIIIIQWWL